MSSRPGWIGLGAGGHARAVLDASVAGGSEFLGAITRDGLGPTDIPILGDDSRLEELFRSGVRLAAVLYGTTKSSRRRQQSAQLLTDIGFGLITVVHPRASISPGSHLGSGVVVLANAVVGPNSELGTNAIVNSSAVVEHDARIGDSCHIAPGAIVCGGASVGLRSHVGAGAVILQGVHVGDDVTVGAGAVVLSDVPDGSTVVGVPAAVVRRLSE